MLVTLVFLHASAFCLQSVSDQVQVRPCTANQVDQVWEFVGVGDGTFMILNGNGT